MALPDTYQEVEYIETTGTQFINTGLYAGNNIQVETKIAVNSTSQPQIVFACYRTSGSADLPNNYGLAAYQNAWYYGLNGSEGNGGTYSPTIGTEYVIVYNNANNYININGSDVLNCAGTTGYTGTTLGIAVRANRNLSGSFKYYYFRMYNKTTGAYERDFVPCYRKSDNVAGLYDTVNNVFYTNAGSGSFIVGPTPAQSGKIKKILLSTNLIRPSVWQPNENTLLYLPFKTDTIDHSGNGVQFVNSGVTVSNGVGVFNGSSWMYTDNFVTKNLTNFTASVWARRTNNPSDWVSILHQMTDYQYNYYGWSTSFQKSGSNYPVSIQGVSNATDVGVINSNINERYLFTYVLNGNEAYCYINGTLFRYGGQVNSNRPNRFAIGGAKWYYSSGGNKLVGNISEVICESKARTAQEVLAYFNNTKSNYGL